MRYSILCTPDSTLLKKRMQELAQSFYEGKNIKQKERIFWADEGLGSDFWEAFSSSALSLEPQCDFIVLRKADEMNAESWKKISDALANLREDAFVVLCIETEWENYFGKLSLKLPLYITNQLCYAYAEKKGWLEKLKPHSIETFRSYIQSGIKKRSLTCEKEIVDILVTILPHNSSSAENALDQLALGVDNMHITKEDLSYIALNLDDLNAFSYIEKLETQKSFDIWRDVLHDKNRAKVNYFAFISALTKQARQMWQILSNETPLELKVYPLQLRTNIAQRLGKKRVAYLFLLLREAEFSVKSGKKDIFQAMEELVQDLSALYKV